MFFKPKASIEQRSFDEQANRLRQALSEVDMILAGAGAGLSAAAGFTYSGERFEQYFHDFREKYGITDMYSGGFYPFQSLEEYWAWWNRQIWANRFQDTPKPLYHQLLGLVDGKDYFVLTTNVDHQFQRAGFDKNRLFYTQGDYGLWQCSEPCHQKTYGNKTDVRQMLSKQKDMKIPTELIPRCPVCGKPMTMNLRCDNTFVQDEGWYEAQERYAAFLRRCGKSHVLFLELGVGANIPGIIKYPFWQLTAQNPNAVYACVNQGEAFAPHEIAGRSICIDSDIDKVLNTLAESSRMVS